VRALQRRPELNPEDSYFMGAYLSAIASLDCERTTVEEITARQTVVEASWRRKV
jgi:hypothetical protein